MNNNLFEKEMLNAKRLAARLSFHTDDDTLKQLASLLNYDDLDQLLMDIDSLGNLRKINFNKDLFCESIL